MTIDLMAIDYKHHSSITGIAKINADIMALEYR